jgi:hypothetical protein
VIKCRETVGELKKDLLSSKSVITEANCMCVCIYIYMYTYVCV